VRAFVIYESLKAVQRIAINEKKMKTNNVRNTDTR